MTATYWVFGGDIYEEMGGMRDFMGVYENEQDAQEAVKTHEASYTHRWADYVKVVNNISEGHFLIRSTAK